MTNQQLIKRIAESDDIESLAAAGRIWKQIKGIIASTVQSGEEVALGTDFGKFVAGKQAARSGTNSLTGKPFSSPEKQVIKFKPSAPLKATIAGK